MRQLYIHLSLRIGGLRRQAETWHPTLRLLAAAPAPRPSQPAARLLPPEGNLRPGGSSAECLNTDDRVSSPRLQVLQLGPAAEERAPLLEASPVGRLRVTPDIQQQTEAQTARLCTSQLLSATTAAVTAAPREIKCSQTSA